MIAIITASGPGWTVEWEHPEDGPQSFYTRDLAKAEQLAKAVAS